MVVPRSGFRIGATLSTDDVPWVTSLFKMADKNSSPLSDEWRSCRGACSPRDWGALFLVSLLPILGYEFGVGNQVEQFSLVQRILDPAFLSGDFYVNLASGFGPRFYYTHFVAALAVFLGLPASILLLTVFTNFGLAVLTFLTARRFLGSGPLAAIAASVLVITNSGFSLGLAGYIRFDSYQAASPAILLAFGGVYLLLAGRPLLASLGFVIASLFHPLVGVETGVVALIAGLIVSGFLGLLAPMRTNRTINVAVKAGEATQYRSLAVRVLAAAGIFIIAVIVLWGLPMAGAPRSYDGDAGYLDVLVRFRAPHHYLAASFPASHYLGFFAFLAAGVTMATAWWLHYGNRPPVWMLWLIVGGVLAACLGAAILVDGFGVLEAATAQPYRLLFLVKWVGFLFAGWQIGRWARDVDWLSMILIIGVVCATGEASGPVLVIALLVGALADHTKSKSAWRAVPLAVIFGLFSVWLIAGYGNQKDLIRAGVAIIVVGLFYADMIGASATQKPTDQASRAVYLHQGFAALFVALVLSFAVLNADARWLRWQGFQAAITDDKLQGDHRDIARWVRQHAPAHSIWIIPPNLDDFRLFARRSVVVDFTSVPFSGEGVLEWNERIRSLYGPVKSSGFRGLLEMMDNHEGTNAQRLGSAHVTFGASFAVLYRQTQWDGPVLYQNETYKAVAIPDAAG